MAFRDRVITHLSFLLLPFHTDRHFMSTSKKGYSVRLGLKGSRRADGQERQEVTDGWTEPVDRHGLIILFYN